jgi:hypothetical protein
MSAVSPFPWSITTGRGWPEVLKLYSGEVSGRGCFGARYVLNKISQIIFYVLKGGISEKPIP